MLKKVILSTLVFGIVLYFIFLYKYPLKYSDIIIKVEESDNHISIVVIGISSDFDNFYFDGNMDKEPYLLDFENQINYNGKIYPVDYRNRYYTIYASLANRLLNHNKHYVIARFSYDGRFYNEVSDEIGFSSHLDQNGNNTIFIQTCSAVYYCDPNGSITLLYDFIGGEKD